ncbi:hypothetical protein [Leptothrix discophora]|uniref:Uncharacterized protein n=1 Tax=Leptothrix discophora TaxID=89 RepID=A0ABT9G4T4_LEPDI|nr:hypothetical protein [Leptothrix discophora]MDP4301474.1 hypothetical protein [Leptothrix discophora]
MPFEIQLWWGFLCAVSVVNLAAWLWTARRLRAAPHPADVHADDSLHRRWQLLLSAGYVLGCAHRSWWPVFDVQRLCLVDHWLSSVVIGRSVATIAELCFAAQWALVLHKAARDTGSRSTERAARLIVPLIVVAEVFSWYSVLSTSNLGHVIEESLWGACALLFVLGLVPIWPQVHDHLRPRLRLWGAAGLAYAVYMFGVDVPMYADRWLADEAAGRHYLSLAQGWADVSARWIVSHRWTDWRSEVIWMSLYFSVAVWLSIALVHAPMRFGTRPARLRYAVVVASREKLPA